MNKKILLVSSLLFSAAAHAQYINGDNNAPVRLSDVVRDYMKSEQHFSGGEDEPAVNGVKEEDKDYHFNRWYWYWKNHTDENGYLVSPVKTWQEWQKYNGSNTQSKTTAGSQANWTPQGPYSSSGGYHGIGRINKIVFHPTVSSAYWVCTAGGGLWKTVNDGASWTCLTADLPVSGTSDLAVNPLNPNTLYLCTGDRDASDTYSMGVMKSTDGGQTWNATGLSWTTSQMRLTNSIVINPIDTNSLTLATSNGIYKTYNGGANWAQVLNSGHFKQVLYHPTDTNILYAARFDGGSSANIFRSANGGASWTQVTSWSNRKRVTLAVTPANVAIVKAILATSGGGLEGIYNSSDTGKTFTKIYGPSGCNGDLLAGINSNSLNSCGNQGWYDLSIAIDPANANNVFVGGVNTRYSTNGGSSWAIATQWWGQAPGIAEVHADKHWHAFHPLVPGRLFECNDGGVYKTDNPSSTLWSDLTNGMNITQFYRNAVADTATYVLGGAQDNGSKLLQSSAWSDPSGGDGMNCEIDYADPGTYYTAVQYGDIYRHSSNWGDATISDNIPGKPSGAWITPYAVSPHNHDYLFAGYKNVYFSTDAGDNWIAISSPAILNAGNLERLALAPSNDSAIYAVPDNSKKVFYTHQFDFAPVQFDSLTCPNAGSGISDIKVDPKDHKHIWVTLGGYNSDQVVDYKFSTNIWTKMNTNLPNVPVHCIDIDSLTGIMYVGTDVGVFYLDTVNKQWEPFNTNLPSIEVADLGINYKTKEIWAATYGRGLWKSVKQEYLADTTDTTGSVSVIPYAADDIIISPNPADGIFTVHTANTRLFGRQVKLSLIDNLGKEIWAGEKVFSGAGDMEAGRQSTARGIYILILSDGHEIIGRKRIVVR